MSESAGGRPWRIAHSEFSLGWGGQEHRVLTELTGFRDRDCAVHLIAPITSCIYERAQAAAVPVVALPTSKPGLIASVYRLARWLEDNRIEVLNTHSSRDGWFVAIAGRLAGVPLIIRSRHIDVTYPNPIISRHAFTTLADHVLCTSDQIRTHLQTSFSIPAKNITTLPTGIDPQLFHPEGTGYSGLPPRSPGIKRIGMVSVLRSWKGHPTFLEAARQLLNEGIQAEFIIVGEGPMRRYIENWLEEMKMGQHFQLLGHTEEVPAVLRELDVLVIPSTRHEGVPQIGLQALASETLVIGSDVGGIPEIVIPGKTGRIFPAEDVGALVNELKAALRVDEENSCLKRNGRTQIERLYSRDHMLDQLDGLYARLCPPDQGTA
jgi:glycosyltransferase involved in cell wall biosynthesis